MARVDGKAWLLMGGAKRLGSHEISVATHDMPVVHATRTVYRFPDVGGASIRLTFTTPALLPDLDALSMPVSYVTFRIGSSDGAVHNVQLYFDTVAEVIVNSPSAKIAWERLTRDNVGGTDNVAMRLGHAQQNPVSKSGDSVRIDWGWWMVVAPPGTESVLAPSDFSRSTFLDEGGLKGIPDSPGSPAPGNGSWNNFMSAAVSANLGSVGKDSPQSWYLAVALDEVVAIKYYGELLPPFWRRDLPVGDAYAVPWALINTIISRYPVLSSASAEQDAIVEQMSELAGGSEYAALTALVFRQVTGSLVLTWRPETSETWYFLKECSTNGDLSTIDLWWPASPMFLALQPSLLVYAMLPLLNFMNNETYEPWPYMYAAHDLGQYPIADRGDDQETMFIETTSDSMFIVAATVLRLGGDWSSSGFANYWYIVKKWARYLMDEALPYPIVQRSTTDWQGQFGNTTNLMSKGIVALAAYAYLASLAEPSLVPEAIGAVNRFASVWMEEAWIRDHAKRQLQDDVCPGDASFSLQYSLFEQELFGLKPFSEKVISGLLTYLQGISDRYGVPQDCTTPTVGGATWMFMMAASGSGASASEMHPATQSLIHAEFLFAHETSTRLPLIDFQNTNTAQPRVTPSQRARPAVGAVYTPLLVSLVKQERLQVPVESTFE
eukprot:TRINITY_DN12233_c0_g2_i1.p1 TRINITY_DN12233_c0_g2~~TRINITY_DN12233_c0_g2_i1.p1  ORF type:complete len:741 (+),score=88.03 TRINITY_DN12233_c0_g2_i1:230-2224(+)